MASSTSSIPASTSFTTCATTSSSSKPSTKRTVLVLDAESRILYTRCNLCTSDWETKDVIVRHPDGTAYHAGCYRLEHGRKATMTLPGISALSSEQRSSFSSNFLKNAAAQAESMHDDPINIEISTAAVQQVPSEDCQSCSRIKAKDFFQCSDTASSIMTQISHFNILVEDETILATFRGASDNFRLSILRKIIKVLLHMASASSQNALWTNRSIATSAALVCKRLEAEFGLDFESAKEDEKLKEVELFLDEDGVRQSMRSIMAGLLVKDANIHQRYPPLKEKPDNHLVISPAWVAGMFDEMSKFFSERLPPNRELHDKAFGSTFWTICGVLDAAVAQPLGRVNPPRKERAVKKVDDAASVTLPHEAQTATRAKAGSGSRATASSSGRGTEKAKAAAPRKSQKAKTFVEQMPEEDEVHRDLDAGSEAYITPNEIQPAQSIDAPNSRRPTRAAAKAASARVAGIALEALEFKRQEEQRAGPSKKRGREAAPIEATENTSPLRAVRTNASVNNSPAASPSKRRRLSSNIENHFGG